MGNPYKLSPKARFKSWLGYGFPFDRHDWFVDRGDRLIHYVIDYYYNPTGPATAAPRGSEDPTAPKLTTAIHVDVRPAVEDMSSFLDRLAMFPARAFGALQRPRFYAEGIDPSTAPPEDKSACVSEGAGGKEKAVETSATVAGTSQQPLTLMDKAWGEVDSKCSGLLSALKSPSLGDEERRSTQVALNYCMGRALCPTEAGKFMKALENNQVSGAAGAAGGLEEEAFGEMTRCVVEATKARGARSDGSSTTLR